MHPSTAVAIDLSRPVRVRFAPSPTGGLHIGGVRTALYNYLFARQHGGTFYLRIEDTDQTRYVAGAEEYIFEALAWLGITPSESPMAGGQFAPYRQSERKDIYRQYAEELVQKGLAYYAFDTPEELEAMRQRLEAAKSNNPSYNAITRMTMRNALTLPADEVQRLREAGTPHVIRLKVPPKEEIRFGDIIRGWVVVHSATMDDKVLLKADGMPTYHLANVVDDYLMQTSHVIRGEEWLPSTPLHVLLYRYLGWEDKMPQFAHLPLLLNPDGKGKLSKRKGAEYGFPVFPLDWLDQEKQELVSGFREAGYRPEAVINFLALLGWNPGTEQEIFSLDELVEAFSLERVHKAGSKFDIEKAKWYNQHYLRAQTDEALATQLLAALTTQGLVSDDVGTDKALAIVGLLKDRAGFLRDFWEGVMYLYTRPNAYDSAAVQKHWNEASRTFVVQAKAQLEAHSGDWAAEALKHLLHELVESQGLKFGKVMPALRIAVSGVGAGADLAGIMAIIGREETLTRINIALEQLSITN